MPGDLSPRGSPRGAGCCSLGSQRETALWPGPSAQSSDGRAGPAALPPRRGDCVWGGPPAQSSDRKAGPAALPPLGAPAPTVSQIQTDSGGNSNPHKGGHTCDLHNHPFWSDGLLLLFTERKAGAQRLRNLPKANRADKGFCLWYSTICCLQSVFNFTYCIIYYMWVKAQHEGALPPPCIVRKDPRVPHTARRGA